MTAEQLRSLVAAHGALAWAAVAATAGALIAVGRRWKGGAAIGGVAAALTAATFVTGALMHPPFQARLRQRLFLASAALGWLFERKEHAAFGALALSMCGAAALGAARLAGRSDEETARWLRRAGAIAMGCALALEALAIGVSIAAARRVAF
jgi:hypothetical protein